MAVQPDTTTGTLTTTAGSINFTTSGTQMLTRGHLPGDRFLVNGLEIQIATITGENSGTLTEICPVAAAVSGFPVRLRFQPDGARVAAQTRNLIDVLGNGTLQSEAAIDGAGGDWLSYFTGSFAKARTKFTAFARTLVANENAASARITLEAVGVNHSGSISISNGSVSLNPTDPAGLLIVPGVDFGGEASPYLVGRNSDNSNWAFGSLFRWKRDTQEWAINDNYIWHSGNLTPSLLDIRPDQLGAIGSYCIAHAGTGSLYTFGASTAGSDLRVRGSDNPSFVGQWRVVGYAANPPGDTNEANYYRLWQRHV